MNFVFDMHRIGQTIACLRREHNMTQMQLADELGVSFQAVSNWERGQSMPDISKLPDLAARFGVTIDLLLGKACPLAEKAAEGKLAEYAQTGAITADELAEAAPLLPPRQLDELTDQLMSLASLPNLSDLLPFLSQEKVDDLLRQRAAQGQELVNVLPFASTRAVDEAARALNAQGKSVAELAPFMRTDTLDDIARQREADGRESTELAPFLSNETLQEIVLLRLKQGRRIQDLLPFADDALLEQLFKAASSAT